MQWSIDFQIAHSKTVESYVTLSIYTLYLCYMLNMGVLGYLQILQYGTCCHLSVLYLFHTKTFHIPHLEVMVEFLCGCLLCKYPVIHLIEAQTIAKHLFGLQFRTPENKHLLRHEVGDEFFDIFVVALINKKLTSRDIEQRKSYSCLAVVYGAKEVVLLVVEHIVLHSHTRCNQFGDTSLHQFLGQFRVFELVADSNTSACPNEFWQVGVESVMRKTSHSIALCSTIVTPCQCDAKYLCCISSIIAVCLIEITTTKQQQSIRMLCFKIKKLFHHRRQFAVFLCHNYELCIMNSLPPFPGEVGSHQYEWYGEYLSHIEGQTLLKCLLHLLGVFYEEAEGEDKQYVESEEERCAHQLRFLAPEVPQHKEEAEICNSLIQLSWMARQHIHTLKDECPRHISRFAYYLAIHQVAHPYKSCCDRHGDADGVEHRPHLHLQVATVE